jgi:hypothetical protein
MKSDRCRWGKQRIMTTRALYYRTGTAFRSKDVWPCKPLTPEVERLKQDAQVLRKRNRLRIEIGVSAVDAQKYTNILWKGSHDVRHSWLG